MPYEPREVRVFAPPSKSRERGDRKWVNGGKREGERSERESVVPRQKKEGVNGEKTGAYMKGIRAA